MLLLAAMLLAADPGVAESGIVEKSLTYSGGTFQDEVIRYQVVVPKIEEGKKYPVVLFLHGAGERGSDNQAQLKYFPALMNRPEYREKFPAFVVAPQCRTDMRWTEAPWGDRKSVEMTPEPGHMLKTAIAALEKTIEEYPIDRDRIYLTGLSMGGYGSWELAARKPEWFAAVAPICGGGDERQAKRLVGLPIWAWHGDKDGAVPVERSQKMIEAIREAGGEPKYTEIAGGGHNVWDQAYQDPQGIIPWMFEQRRKSPEKR
jgi:predicted peptidase